PSFAMRASCFSSWSVCRRSCSAPMVFSCWSASTPFMMPSSLVMTGSNFSFNFLSIRSSTASRMRLDCGQQPLHFLFLRVKKFLKFGLGGGHGFGEVGFGGRRLRCLCHFPYTLVYNYDFMY